MLEACKIQRLSRDYIRYRKLSTKKRLQTAEYNIQETDRHKITEGIQIIREDGKPNAAKDLERNESAVRQLKKEEHTEEI